MANQITATFVVKFDLAVGVDDLLEDAAPQAAHSHPAVRMGQPGNID